MQLRLTIAGNTCWSTWKHLLPTRKGCRLPRSDVKRRYISMDMINRLKPLGIKYFVNSSEEFTRILALWQSEIASTTLETTIQTVVNLGAARCFA
jgi:hypothetical protein